MAFLVVAPALTPPSYTTSFARAEVPISEDRRWTSGGINPSRTAVVTDGAHAYGTMGSFDSTNFIDSIAILTPSFPANQSVQGTIYNSSALSGQEAELVLRGNLTTVTNTGYEIDLVLSSGSISVVSWNGPANTFTVLQSGITANVSFVDGAVWYAQIVGTVITVKCNGTTVTTYDTVSDAFKVASGNPGIGFWNQTGSVANSTKLGWKSFTAGSL